MKISRACIWIALGLLSSTTTTATALEGEEESSHLRGDNSNNNNNSNHNGKKHRKLQADENGMYRVMVHVTGGNHDRVGQQLGGAPGCTMHYDFENMDTFVATVDEDELEILQNDPGVDEIEEDYRRYMQVVDQDYHIASDKPGTVIEDRPVGDELPPPVRLAPLDLESIESLEEWNAKLTEQEQEQDDSPNDGRLRRNRHLQSESNIGLYGLDTTQARLAWPYSKGAGIKVCVIDSGLDRNHNDFVTSRLDGYTPAGGLSWFQDGDGHGTHVTGTIAAAANNRGSIGVAPDVEVFVVRVFNNNGGFAYASGLVDAANRCVAGGARVINMSLGGGGRSSTEERAFQAIRTNGVIVVAAAGNNGNTAFSYPASYNGIISVAAVDRNNRVTSFSQRNSRVDISGPGTCLSTREKTKSVGLFSIMTHTHSLSFSLFSFSFGQVCKCTAPFLETAIVC